VSHGIEASNVKAKEPRYIVTVTVFPHCLRAVFQFEADRHIAGSSFANVHRRQTSVCDEEELTAVAIPATNRSDATAQCFVAGKWWEFDGKHARTIDKPTPSHGYCFFCQLASEPPVQTTPNIPLSRRQTRRILNSSCSSIRKFTA
jgi:hypothetical protein